MILLLLLACNGLQPLVTDCEVTSTVPNFSPTCDRAELTLYPARSIITVLGSPGSLTVTLPADPEAIAYGGEDDPIEAVVTVGNKAFDAVPETSLVTFSRVAADLAQADLDLDFGENGMVQGPISLTVSEEEAAAEEEGG